MNVDYKIESKVTIAPGDVLQAITMKLYNMSEMKSDKNQKPYS